MAREDVRDHFEGIAGDYDRWKEKSAYYYRLLAGIYRERVPEGASVLEIGCGTGTLLAALSPARGVGVDVSPRMVEIAAAKHPSLSFRVADAEAFDPGETFDYIIVPDVVEHLKDPAAMFRSARKACHPETRVIVTCVNPLWAPILHLAERLGLKMPEGEHRWLSAKELLRMSAAAGFDAVEFSGRILCPKEVPLLAGALNRAAARFPFLRSSCLVQVLVQIPRADSLTAPPVSSLRKEREIAHSRMLARGDTEHLWGWDSPAGAKRAERRGELIANGAGLRPGTRTLEIGCGTGMFTEMFVRTGTQIVAVDISGELLAKARERDLPANQVLFLEKRFEECEVDGPFDAIVGSSILHHLEVAESLSRIHALLKPGGVMCFAEPNLLNPQVFIERKFTFLRKWLSYVSPDETAFVRWRIASMLRRSGFDEVEVTPFDWLHPSTPGHLIGTVSALGNFLENTPVLREFSGSVLIRCRRPPWRRCHDLGTSGEVEGAGAPNAIPTSTG
jgi:2-polyprenyl-3-methyl-5-hydroxy-6-metoxy-1,4-benzoquinol methylase